MMSNKQKPFINDVTPHHQGQKQRLFRQHFFAGVTGLCLFGMMGCSIQDDRLNVSDEPIYSQLQTVHTIDGVADHLVQIEDFVVAQNQSMLFYSDDSDDFDIQYPFKYVIDDQNRTYWSSSGYSSQFPRSNKFVEEWNREGFQFVNPDAQELTVITDSTDDYRNDAKSRFSTSFEIDFGKEAQTSGTFPINHRVTFDDGTVIDVESITLDPTDMRLSDISSDYEILYSIRTPKNNLTEYSVVFDYPIAKESSGGAYGTESIAEDQWVFYYAGDLEPFQKKKTIEMYGSLSTAVTNQTKLSFIPKNQPTEEVNVSLSAEWEAFSEDEKSVRIHWNNKDVIGIQNSKERPFFYQNSYPKSNHEQFITQLNLFDPHQNWKIYKPTAQTVFEGDFDDLGRMLMNEAMNRDFPSDNQNQSATITNLQPVPTFGYSLDQNGELISPELPPSGLIDRMSAPMLRLNATEESSIVITFDNQDMELIPHSEEDDFIRSNDSNEDWKIMIPEIVLEQPFQEHIGNQFDGDAQFSISVPTDLETFEPTPLNDAGTITIEKILREDDRDTMLVFLLARSIDNWIRLSDFGAGTITLPDGTSAEFSETQSNEQLFSYNSNDRFEAERIYYKAGKNSFTSPYEPNTRLFIVLELPDAGAGTYTISPETVQLSLTGQWLLPIEE